MELINSGLVQLLLLSCCDYDLWWDLFKSRSSYCFCAAAMRLHFWASNRLRLRDTSKETAGFGFCTWTCQKYLVRAEEPNKPTAKQKLAVLIYLFFKNRWLQAHGFTHPDAQWSLSSSKRKESAGGARSSVLWFQHLGQRHKKTNSIIKALERSQSLFQHQGQRQRLRLDCTAVLDIRDYK